MPAASLIRTQDEAAICDDFRHFGFKVEHIPAGDRQDPAEFLCLTIPDPVNQDLYRLILADILRPGVTTLEISRDEPGRICLRHITAEPVTLTAVVLDEGHDKMCSGHRGPVPGRKAFETADGWLMCEACAEHVRTCTDPDCDH